jgi:hypothetical protein
VPEMALDEPHGIGLAVPPVVSQRDLESPRRI